MNINAKCGIDYFIHGIYDYKETKVVAVTFPKKFCQKIFPGKNVPNVHCLLGKEKGCYNCLYTPKTLLRKQKVHLLSLDHLKLDRIFGKFFPLVEEIINAHLLIKSSNNNGTCTCDFSFGNWSCRCGAGRKEIEEGKDN